MPLAPKLMTLTLAAALLAACGRAPGLGAYGAQGTGAMSAEQASARLYRELMADFDHDGDGAIALTEARGSWLEDAFPTLDANGDQKASQIELTHFFEAQGRQPDATWIAPEGWGAIGGGAAGLVALGMAGYLTYTGLKGSHDLMYPTKETFAKPPNEYGMTFEKVSFKSADGLPLAGWYVPASMPTKKAILLFHGHGSNKDKVFNKYALWLQDEFNLFIYDSRYSGESAGKYQTLGYLETPDAIKAVEELRQRGNNSIGLMGESMGGAVAIECGAKVPDVKAVWADCSFDTLHDAIAPRAAARKYALPELVADSVVATVSLKVRGRVAEADPIRWVAKVAPRPLYLVHGQKDEETTPENSEKLFKKALEPKTLWRTPEARHAESWEKYPEEYRERLRDFFEAAL